MPNCRKTYSDYNRYLEDRGVYKALCKQNLTKGGTINGNLIIDGVLQVGTNTSVITTDTLLVSNLLDVSNGRMFLDGDFIVTGDISGNLAGYVTDGSFSLLTSDVSDLSSQFVNLSSDVTDLSSQFVNLSSDVTDLSSQFVTLSSDVTDLSTNFYNIYDVDTGTIDISNGIFTGDVSINGVLQVGTSSTYITTDSIHIDNKLDISNNMEISGNIIISNGNAIHTNVIYSDDTVQITISNDEYMSFDTSGITLFKHLITPSNGLVLVKNSSNNQPSRLYGEILTILEMGDVSFNQDTSFNFTLKPNGILYSNSDNSSNIYYNDASNHFILDISNNQDYFIDSFIEMYVNMDVSTNSNENIAVYIQLEGTNGNKFTIDSRSFRIRNDTISASFGPCNFLTSLNGVLTDIYKLSCIVDIITGSTINNDVTNIRFTIKQKIL